MRRSPRPLPLLAVAVALAACVARPGVSPESLADRRWTLVELAGAPVSATGESTPSLRLAGDGTLAGQGGCNGFGGRWSLDDGRLVTSGLAITRRACADPDRTAREQRFVALVEARPAVAVRGDTLVLTGDAAATARLVAAP